MSKRTGSLSINSENIFPIIKKWLYSDHDIFAREVISNGCDAITKLAKLEMMGEYEYVLGLEPGNCLPDGRDVMRKNNMLCFLKPDETKTHHIKFEFAEEK